MRQSNVHHPGPADVWHFRFTIIMADPTMKCNILDDLMYNPPNVQPYNRSKRMSPGRLLYTNKKKEREEQDV